MDMEIYEQYVDATVALFMEEYAEAETDYMLELCKEDLLNEDFPEDLDIKCQTIIRKTFAQKKRKKVLKLSKRVLLRVAMFVLVLLSSASVLFMTAEAVRTPVINFYLQRFDKYSRVTLQNNGSSDRRSVLNHPDIASGEPNQNVVYNDLFATFLPSTYQLEFDSLKDSKYGVLMYRDSSSRSDVCFEIHSGNDEINIDTENCDLCEEISIENHAGFYVEKDGRRTILWVDENGGAVFSLIADGMEYSTMVSLVRKIILAK